MIKQSMTLFIHTENQKKIINKSDTDAFETIYTTIISNIQKILGKCADWITNLVIDDNNNISNYNPLSGCSDIKLPKELDHPRKGLINIQSIDDNECFKWSLFRYLNPSDHNPKQITKTNKNFPQNIDFKDIKSPFKVRDIYQTEKKNSIGNSVFGYENKEKHPIYVSKKVVKKKHVDLL